jgi:hypothetical protein
MKIGDKVVCVDDDFSKSFDRPLNWVSSLPEKLMEQFK